MDRHPLFDGIPTEEGIVKTDGEVLRFFACSRLRFLGSWLW